LCYFSCWSRQAFLVPADVERTPVDQAFLVPVDVERTPDDYWIVD
jgi:hypothetical protein